MAQLSLYLLLAPFWWWWPPLASALPLLHLVAVVLVLDTWSVLGVAPVVSFWRVGVPCELISDFACFLHLCVSPYFPAHLGSRMRQEGRCPTGEHLKLTGLIFKRSGLGKPFIPGMLPLFKVFLGMTFGVCGACFGQLNPCSFSAETGE